MIPLALDMATDLVPGQWDRAGWTDEITGMQVDSRRIDEGDLFVAIGDGVDYRKHAFARGAAATLVPADPFAALAAIAGAVRERSDARFVAITGSMGKTSTKDVLAAICAGQARTDRGGAQLQQRDRRAADRLPRRAGHRDLHPRARDARVRPDRRVVRVHAAAHRCDHEHCAGASGEGRNARGRRPREERADRRAAARRDGDRAADFRVSRTDIDVVRVGEDVRLESFEPPLLRTSIGTAEVNFSAQHLALNALSAFATARALGLEIPERIDVTFAEWRNQELPLPGGGLLINDAWNANPISMRAALEHLRQLAAGRRRIAVLGEMAELGDYTDEAHREVARAVEEIGVDVLISVGERARVYGGRNVADADEAIALLRAELKPGDCVLVKGARVLGLERVAESLAGVTA